MKKKKRRFLLFMLVALIVSGLVLPAIAGAFLPKSPSLEPQPYVKLTFPKGGETLYLGTTYNITWEGEKFVYVSLSLDDGSFEMIISANRDYPCLFTPNKNSNKARIRLHNDLASDTSGYFSILDTPQLEAVPPPKIPDMLILPPAPPSGLTAIASSFTAIALTWTDNAANETGFRIERKTELEDWTQIGQIGPNATSYLDQGLTPGTRYDYRVRTYNSLYNSAYSDEAHATTLGIKPVLPPPQPQPQPLPLPLPQPQPQPGLMTIRLFIGKTQYFVNDVPQAMDTAPIIREGRTLLPIRYVVEPMGAGVGWDGSQQKAVVTLGADEIELWIGQNRARVNGTYRYLDAANQNVVPIVVPPGRTMLPLRFIAEAVGCQVEWNAVKQEVTITYAAP